MKTQIGPFVKPLPGNSPKSLMGKYKFFWKDNTVEIHEGFSPADALRRGNYPEEAIKDVVLWYKIPAAIPGIISEKSTYQIMVKDTANSDWDFAGRPDEDKEGLIQYAISAANSLRKFAVMVIDLSTEKSVFETLS